MQLDCLKRYCFNMEITGRGTKPLQVLGPCLRCCRVLGCLCPCFPVAVRWAHLNWVKYWDQHNVLIFFFNIVMYYMVESNTTLEQHEFVHYLFKSEKSRDIKKYFLKKSVNSNIVIFSYLGILVQNRQTKKEGSRKFLN